jgi:hypothetical protein
MEAAGNQRRHLSALPSISSDDIPYMVKYAFVPL